MRLSYNEICARVARYADGYKATYAADETVRRVQAGQWINWPLFLSQPVVPVLLYLFPSALIPIIIILIAVNVLWMHLISQSFVSLLVSKWGVRFARLKWLACPLFAMLLWFEGHVDIAAVALLWPVMLLLLLFALHPLFPPNALADTQEKFRLAEKSTVND